jgi:SecD/SecF fusion protein
MQTMHWKILIIAVAIGLSVWSLLGYGVRLGKDLAGGLSLVYQLNIPDDASSDEAERILNQTILVLKNRLNPQGVFDLSILPMGRDRIEIVMPLPSVEVTVAKQEFEEKVELVLEHARIEADLLEAALREGTAVHEFGGDSEGPQRQRMQDLQDAFTLQQEALAAYEAARAAGAPEDEIARLEDALSEAIVRNDDLKEDVLRYSLTEQDFLRMLRLPSEPRQAFDEATGEMRAEPSQRSVELDSIKERFAHLADEIDQAVAAFDSYNSMRRGLDDPEDLKRLLRGAGVLEFRIAVTAGAGQAEGFNPDQLRQDLLERGPEERTSPFVRWMRINDLRQWYEDEAQLAALQRDPVAYFSSLPSQFEAASYGGDYYLLIYDTDARKLTHEDPRQQWSIVSAGPTVDDLGRPAVAFNLDNPGGIAMRRLTGANVGEPMAIILDEQVYSAPNINSPIGSSGIIQGSFSEAELNYLIRVLAAGSLEARLSAEPIAEMQIAPELGRDNLERGLWACLWGLLATMAFMAAYYFFAGVVADIALFVNAILIFGIMAMQQASFTMPGIAGVVLSIGMAVDANVLIYERIREEYFAGVTDLREAIRIGYSKALSSIIDGNLTNLIVVFVLYQTATTEVKGFALTMGIGVLSTLFTALFVTRVIYTIYTDVFKIKTLPMLPTAFPAIHRALEPNINWIGLRKVFLPASGVAIIASVLLVGSLGSEIYDTEFRGGISATFETRIATPEDMERDLRASRQGRILLERGAVERTIHAIGESNPSDPLLSNFDRADVIATGRGQEGAWSDSFQIKVAAEANTVVEQERITNAIVASLQEYLAATPPYSFDYEDEPRPPVGSVFDISEPFLGQVIGRQGLDVRVDQYSGGVAVLIEGLDPPADIQDVTDRIRRTRNQEAYRAAADRSFEVVGVEPAESGDGYRAIALVVHDPDYEYVDNPELWQTQVADIEWQLVTEALKSSAQLEQVSSFSSSIAQTLAAGATTAIILSLLLILIYIWFRFGSLRYSMGAIASLAHDVIIVLGLIALTHYIADSPIASALGIEPFLIDLNVVAALLTIIGYSLNDSIVIMDRIRENRGKIAVATGEQVNKAINQTLSRTMLTGGTTIIAVFIMYVEGGTGIRPFTYALFTGLIIGTYSSIGIAAPLVVEWRKRKGGDSSSSEPYLAERGDTEQPETVVG